MVRYQQRFGYTIVELLIAFTLLVILVSLLLPAVQVARETGRRIQCANNLHQMGIALHNYHDANRKFPIGIVHPNQTFWSALLLPQLEEASLYQSLDFSAGWDLPGSNNARACQTYLSVYRCPSSAAPLKVDVQGIEDRVPSTYLAVGSGTDLFESGAGKDHLGQPKRDGLMFVNSSTAMSRILDGSSNTLAIGEALFRADVTAQDLDRSTLQIVDHWYIGSSGVLWQPTGVREVSEAIGSTGVSINSVLGESWIDAKEMCFSSLHRGGCLFVYADGHVQYLSEGIDREIYSHLGTIAGKELATSN